MFDKMSRHADLVSGMSKRVGLDWGEIIMNNPEKAQDYRSAVMKCTQCQELGACQKFLEHNGQAAQAPDYCVNAALFEKLQNG